MRDSKTPRASFIRLGIIGFVLAVFLIGYLKLDDWTKKGKKSVKFNQLDKDSFNELKPSKLSGSHLLKTFSPI